MRLRNGNILPLPLLLLITDPKPLIPIPYDIFKRQLALLRIAHHQLRLPQRQLIPLVHLPEMVRLAIQANDILHLFRFGDFPRGAGDVGVRHDKHPALDFEDVTVPELTLFCVESGVKLGGDHIFDADEAGVFGGGVVDEALADVYVVLALRGGHEALAEVIPSLMWEQ